MEYQAFIDTVRHEAHVSGDEAARVACATLETLSERITAGEAQDIAERLPQELRSCVHPRRPPEIFDFDEFLQRLSQRAGVDESSAEREARAVFAALWSAVGADEFADMRAQLPQDFDPLLDEAAATARPAPEPIALDELLDRVAVRAGLDRDAARRSADAVLEVLAMRIAGGQVEDLEAQLPPELRPAMERGRARVGGRAQALALEEFVDEIAAVEGVDRGLAKAHARAVLSTLREMLGAEEWSDTWAQLPDEYQRLVRS